MWKQDLPEKLKPMVGRHSSVPMAAQAVHAAEGHGEELSGEVGRKRFLKMAFELHFEMGNI